MSDIVGRLRFDAARCEVDYSKGIAGNITEAADEIERLRAGIDIARSGLLKIERQAEEARAVVTKAMRTINGSPDATLSTSNQTESKA